jgi:hypothetical protein
MMGRSIADGHNLLGSGTPDCVFHKFKPELLGVSMKEFRNFGKLMQKGCYFQCAYKPPILLETSVKQM